MNAALIRRRVADVRRAIAAAKAERHSLAVAPSRDPKHLVGRWALPSGQAFTVLWVDEPPARALCGGGGRRWYVAVTDLYAMLDRKQLRYLGRRRSA